MFSLLMALAVVLGITAPDHWGGIPNPLDAFMDAEHSHGFTPVDEHPAGLAHGRHCHGDAANCSDLPLTSVGGFLVLAAMLAMGGVHSSLGRLFLGPNSPFLDWNTSPLLRPPRRLAPPAS